jgi:outer membrane protein assembly factor BamB
MYSGGYVCWAVLMKAGGKNTMIIKNWKIWTSAALTAALLTGVQTGVSSAAQAEETAVKLTQPAFWAAPALPAASEQNGTEQGVERSVHTVPDQGLVYVHTRQAVNTGQDKTGYLDILQAYNDQTGELKWQYELHKEGKPYAASTQLMYTESGGIYIYAQFTDGTARIHAVSPKGEELWAQEVASGSKVSFLSSSKLLVYKESEPSLDGSVSTTFTQYSDTGKFIAQSMFGGTVIFAGDGRVVMNVDRKVEVDGQWQDDAHPEIKILNDSLNILDSYTFPTTTKIYDAGNPVIVLDDDTLLIRAVSNTQGNLLLGFNKDGERMWDRLVPEGALIEPSDAGSYAVYADGKIELYNVFNKMAERTFTYDPSDAVSIEQTEEGKLRLVIGSNVYVLDPQTLKTSKLYKLDYQNSPYDTTDKAVFWIVNNQLVKGLVR